MIFNPKLHSFVNFLSKFNCKSHYMNLLDLALLNRFLYFWVLIKVQNFCLEVLNPQFLIKSVYCISTLTPEKYST